MRNLKTEFLIIGAAFGGSLMALILKKLGFDCIILEKVKHPRFAIGESSIPLANLSLETLCNR